jgi:hypothetical protein
MQQTTNILTILVLIAGFWAAVNWIAGQAEQDKQPEGA